MLKVIVFSVCWLASAQALTQETQFTNSLNMEFVLIKAGSFIMGSPKTEQGRRDDETQHEVVISKNYYLQTTEVTRKQWVGLMQGDPSPFRNCGEQCPVSRVQYEWIQVFINKLNKQDSKYTYRLPTEAEWEYAARAGTKTPFHTGKCLNIEYANFQASKPYKDCPLGERSKQPAPVASFKPNQWGLYDMHGNVWEMVSDFYGPYPQQKVTDPQGPETGERHVVRGSSWFSGQDMARAASRLNARKDNAGFRLVAMPK